jgi:hypothetical protein
MYSRLISMRNSILTSLQIAISLIGIVVLFFLIRFPLTEGRATDLDLIQIYTDPIIVYGYLSSTAFFIGLYQVHRILDHVKRNKMVTKDFLMNLKNLKYLAIILFTLIAIATVYITTSWDGEVDEDPVGFVSISIIAIAICMLIALVSAFLERTMRVKSP